MSTRGSLLQLLQTMAVLFKADRAQTLAIIHNKAGKYYTLLTERELLTKSKTIKPTGDRLVMHITSGELRSIFHVNQLDLYREST